MSRACANPLDLETLVAHWLWESHQTSPGVEEHLLECETCSNELARIVALADGIRDVARRGDVQVIVSTTFLDWVAADGLRLREYRLAPGGSVECSVAPADDVLVARLTAAPSDAAQVDLAWFDAQGNEHERFRDVPLLEGGREIVWVQRIGDMRALPKVTMRARLLAVDGPTERVLAEYTFNHTPAGPRPGES